MSRNDIFKTLKGIEASISNIEDVEGKNTLSILLNMIEKLASENEQLSDDNQKFKDEINRLKGEQGKPEIKANKKDGDVSSEKERKDAESDDPSKKEGFKLDKNSLEKLKESRLSAELLTQLSNMSGNKYSDEMSFIGEVESLIDEALSEESRTLLLQYARYKKRNRKPKIADIVIDKYEVCPVDKTELPDDVINKGYIKKTVQDIIIQRRNVEFKRECFYSPSLKKCYFGAIPLGYEGDFGPHINADIIAKKYIGGMSIPKIASFYKDTGTIISESYISNRLSKTRYMDVFHGEKDEMYQAALEVSSFSQIDDTGMRVNGKNHYTQIICNDFFTAFFTTPKKNRLTIIDVLRNFKERAFLLNEETIPLLKHLKIPKKDLLPLQKYQRDTPYCEQEMLEHLQEVYGIDGSPRKRMKVLEACAIASYRQDTGISGVKVLVCDDAPQFKLITDDLALCWIHEGRHYKRLNPMIPLHQEKVSSFIQCFWEYYRKLHHYKENPDDSRIEVLRNEFDVLFSTKTDYEELDERIAKSKNKKDELLLVLSHPEVPLHNNSSENGARIVKRRLDVSLQTVSDEGTKAMDTMMSVVETCRKLGVSAYKFIYDRVTGEYKMPSLAEMIRARAIGCQIPP